MMSDWIDHEKAAEIAQSENRKIKDQLRLHNAQLIQARTPGFFGSVIECVRTASSKLRSTFPDDLSKQCSLSNTGNVWTVQGCKVPWKILQLQLNLAGQCVDIAEGSKESRDRTVAVGSDQISIRVNDEDDVEFYFHGIRHLTPEHLAESLIKYVRG
jgi:hypothetical protein